MKPTVSIITPCYNGAKYLRETLESALNQTHPPLEVIVVDDGSTDDSAAIAESFGPPVRVIRQQNQGESVARNRGIAEAQGTQILFLDADDLLHPEALERLSTAVDGVENGVGLMACGFFTEDPRQPFHVQRPNGVKFFPNIFGGNIGAIHCWLTPTDLLREVGGFCGPLQYFEDWDLWAQIGLAGATLAPIDFVGCYYRRFAGAQSHTAPKVERSLGHATVLQRLIDGMLQRRSDLLETCAEKAFWGGWTALHRSRELGASWSQVAPLARTLRELVRRSPASLRQTSFARMVRFLGMRCAEAIRNSFVRNGEQSVATTADPIEKKLILQETQSA
jgi:glycosyltransferase involved in cell wall biosynthesis